jgi:predicted phosphodiesterase
MGRSINISVIAIALIVTLTACTSILGVPTNVLPEITEIASSTLAPVATETPSPTSTLAPSETPLPTDTPEPTFTPTAVDQFSFALVSDIHKCAGPGEYDTPQYFRGAAEQIAALGVGAFIISPGDSDALDNIRWTIDQYIGKETIWFPVIGNHEALDPAKLERIRSYPPDSNGIEPPNIVRSGPPSCPQTTYSFDYINAHFVVLNLYCDKTGDAVLDGDVGDTTYNWLVDDLNATDKEIIFVIGHEPLNPQPDMENGRLRHIDDSLNKYPANRDRFLKLLKDGGVTAYINGHTHNFSVTDVGGVWQVDPGQARGLCDPGTRSTLLMVHVYGDVVIYEAYRDDANGGPYGLATTGVLSHPK